MIVRETVVVLVCFGDSEIVAVLICFSDNDTVVVIGLFQWQWMKQF